MKQPKSKSKPNVNAETKTRSMPEIKISNFRNFKKEVTVRLAPITVLIGYNAVGKTSVIEAILKSKKESKKFIRFDHDPDELRWEYIWGTCTKSGGEHTLMRLDNIFYEDDPGKIKFLKKHMEKVLGLVDPNIIRFGGMKRCCVKNIHTGTKTTLPKIGAAGRYCLPFLSFGATMKPNSTLLIEHPETNLHPASQLELGEFFADLWTDRQVKSVIETHSGNLLLRLQRLVKIGKLDHNDINIAFVEYKAGVPSITNLSIDKHGNLDPGLPMVFFGADVVEGLSMGAKS